MHLRRNVYAAAATVLFLSATEMLSKSHLPSSLPSAGSLARSGCGIMPASGVNGCSKKYSLASKTSMVWSVTIPNQRFKQSA